MTEQMTYKELIREGMWGFIFDRMKHHGEGSFSFENYPSDLAFHVKPERYHQIYERAFRDMTTAEKKCQVIDLETHQSIYHRLTKDWHVLTLFDEKARRIVSQKIIFRGGTR